MKQFIHTTIIFLGLITIMSGCDEDFITKTPQQSLSNETAITNANSAEVALNGIYSNMTEWEYYGRNYMLIPDLYSDNSRMRVQNAGRYLGIYRHSHTDNNVYAQDIWQRGYEVINSANALLAAMENKDIDAPDVEGQALALRALAHFDLVRFFAQPYNLNDNGVAPAGGADGNGGHLGVPLMIESDPSANPARNTVKEVYDQIIADLQAAIELMNGQTLYKMDANAGKALLSRVYMYRASGGGSESDWEKCRDLALEVINSSNYSLISNDNYLESWQADGHSEYLFYLKYRSDDYQYSNALGSMYIPASYGDVVATRDLLDLIPDGDIRQNLYFGDHDGGFILPYSSNKGLDKYFIGKYPGRAGIFGVDNLPVIRYSEMYLNLAEALYNLGNDTQAEDYLSQLMERVNPHGSVTDYGGSISQQIYTFRRIELAFEGHRFFDLKRRHQDIVRNDITTENVNAQVNYPDYRYVLPIPEREMEVNSNMVQNPNYN